MIIDIIIAIWLISILVKNRSIIGYALGLKYIVTVVHVTRSNRYYIISSNDSKEATLSSFNDVLDYCQNNFPEKQIRFIKI